MHASKLGVPIRLMEEIRAVDEINNRKVALLNGKGAAVVATDQEVEAVDRRFISCQWK